MNTLILSPKFTNFSHHIMPTPYTHLPPSFLSSLSVSLSLFPFVHPSEGRFQIQGPFIPKYSVYTSQEQGHGNENVFEAAIHPVTQCAFYGDSEEIVFLGLNTK